MWCFVRFGTICTILKTWKTPMEECYFLIKLQAEFTKINTPPWLFLTCFKLCKWYQTAQSVSYIPYFSPLYSHVVMDFKSAENNILTKSLEITSTSCWCLNGLWTFLSCVQWPAWSRVYKTAEIKWWKTWQT